MTALAADVLNIKPVMHFSTGTLDTYQKCRGMKKARKVMIDAMKHELETNFREEYEAGNVYLMAASSSTDEVTAEWMAQIKESFPGMDVMCDKLSFGLSCHIGGWAGNRLYLQTCRINETYGKIVVKSHSKYLIH